MVDPLIIFTIALAASFLISELFYRLRYPRVLGQILAGMILGLPLIKQLIFPEGDLSAFELLSELGIVFLLLLTGLEMNYQKLKKVSKDATIIAFFAAIVPFALGFVSVEILGQFGIIPLTQVNPATGEILVYNLHIMALVVGACLSLTSEGTNAELLMELKVLNTKVGSVLMGAGIMDDVFEIGFLALILTLIPGAETTQILFFPLELILFTAIIYLLFKTLPRIMRFIQRENSDVSLFTTTILIGLFVAILSLEFGLGPIIGAFVAGVIIQLSVKDKQEERGIVDNLKVLTLGLIVPFFFIYIGLNFDYTALLTIPLLIVIITIVATIGKILGSMLAHFFSDLSFRQTYIIGCGMNSRGAIELVIAGVAKMNNLISSELFSAIVVMTVITTLLFPLVLRHEIRKNPKVMS